VTAQALEQMRPGSVVVDMAASDLGGNVELSKPDKTAVLYSGVTVIGAGNLPSAMATAASTAYARNVIALLTHLVRDGALVIAPDDEIQAGVVVTHRGEIVNQALGAVLVGSDGTLEGVS
jgi:NAD(P) transhydrogenase subunit alpha